MGGCVTEDVGGECWVGAQHTEAGGAAGVEVGEGACVDANPHLHGQLEDGLPIQIPQTTAKK